MPYRWIEEVSRADLAFEATGPDLVEVFRSAWEATLAAMVDGGIETRGASRHRIAVEGILWEDLLHATLEQVIFTKDAEGVLLVPLELELRETADGVTLSAATSAVRVETMLERFRADVKAVTHHHFSLSRDGAGWVATVVLDV